LRAFETCPTPNVVKIRKRCVRKIKVLLTMLTKEEVLVSRERAPEFKTWLGN
jgi:hypothetical protein